MENQQRFKKMLEDCPVMAAYYDAETQTVDVRGLGLDFSYKSSGQQIMLAFLKVVWDGAGD